MGAWDHLILFEDLRAQLTTYGLKSIANVGTRGIQSNGLQRWIMEKELRFVGELVDEWSLFI